jgi:hypothetical protein
MEGVNAGGIRGSYINIEEFLLVLGDETADLLYVQVDPGNAGYSSLQVMGASRVVILYEVSDERARVMTPDRLVFRVVWN